MIHLQQIIHHLETDIHCCKKVTPK